MTSTGYYKIDLRKNNVRKIKPIHRLVAETFIPKSNGYSEVNHKDGNKKNNNINNLEWVTRAENIKHSYATGLHIHSPECKPVSQIDIDTGQIINEYKSINEAAKQLGIRHESISACVNGVTNSYGGYKWKKIDREIGKVGSRMLRITKLDFELGKNTEKIPNGLWYVVADYVKRGEDSYDRAKRRFAVTTLVARLNEIRARDDVDESDFRLILMAEINQVYNKRNELTVFEQDIIKYIVEIFKILIDGGVL